MDLDPADPQPAPPGEVPSWVTSGLRGIRAGLNIAGPAGADTASRTRREFAAWLTVDLAAGDLFDDLVLVVYEALANAAEHAYADTPTGTGPVALRVHRSRTCIQMTVSDQGHWRAPAGAGFRGRGLSLMRLLVGDLHIERGPSGTVVHLRTALPPPRPAA